MHTFFVYVCFHFSWVYTQEWNCQVTWYKFIVLVTPPRDVDAFKFAQAAKVE